MQKKEMSLLAKIVLILLTPLALLSFIINLLICIIGTPIILLAAIKFGHGANYKERLLALYKKILINGEGGFCG
jgi:hypothetical protein